MKLPIAILLVAAAGFAQATDALLAQLEGQGRDAATATDLRMLADRLSADARDPGLVGPAGRQIRAARAARTLAYLGGLRQLQGEGIAPTLAACYRSVAILQESGGDPRWIDRRGALQSYQSSAAILNQMAEQNPDDPRIRGELMGVGARVRALGGTLPVWIRMPVGGQPADNGGIPDQVQPVVPREGPVFEMPAVDLALLPDDRRKECGDAIDRYSGAAASAQGALSVLDGIRSSVEGRGLTLRSDYTSSAARLTQRMDTARRNLERGDCRQANASLDVAEAEVARLMKNLGQ
jgi:hypothetical protein